MVTSLLLSLLSTGLEHGQSSDTDYDEISELCALYTYVVRMCGRNFRFFEEPRSNNAPGH